MKHVNFPNNYCKSQNFKIMEETCKFSNSLCELQNFIIVENHEKHVNFLTVLWASKLQSCRKTCEFS